MSAESCCSSNCIEAWAADRSRARAETFDAIFANCQCEQHSLGTGTAVANDDLVARIFTTPYSYDLSLSEVLYGRLMRVYSDGLSLFRPGCTEVQLREAVRRLTEGGEEKNELAGVALLPARELRSLGEQSRWFCVYDTDGSEFDVHADLIGTWPDRTLSKSKNKGEQQIRLRSLSKRFSAFFISSSSVDQLIEELRKRQFSIL